MPAEAMKTFGRGIGDNQSPSAILGFLRPINVEQVARELKIDVEAKERGRSNLPSTSDQLLDSVEQKITQRIESEWTWQGGEFVNNLRAYASRLVGLSIHAEFERLRLMAGNALARLRSTIKIVLSELGPLQEEYIAARHEFDEFRRKHKISRPARNPFRRWTTAGFLFVLVAIESVINGVFFAKGNAFGFVGGVGTAIGISGVNVVLAFVLGLLPARWIHHRNIAICLAGLVFTTAGLISLMGLHLFAAHFRDATALVGDEKAFATALKTLATVPWEFADISSVYLFVLGAVFGLSSLWKGHSFDDPYPGYGAVYRRMVAARDNYAEEHSSLFDDLEDIKEETVKALDEGIQRIPAFPQQLAGILAQRAALSQEFRAYQTAVETSANQLLMRYRDANRRARSTDSPPHFNESWSLKYSFLDTPEVRTLLTAPSAEPLNVSECLAELRELSRQILAEYEALLARYPHSSEMT